MVCKRANVAPYLYLNLVLIHPIFALISSVSCIFLIQVGLRIYNPIPLMEENIEDGKSKDTAKTTFRDYVDLESNLVCSLTTHRLVFLRNSSAPISTGKAHLNEPTSMASFISLSMIGCVSPKGLGFMASPKLKMTTYSYGDISLSFETSRDRDDMLSSLSRCLGK